MAGPAAVTDSQCAAVVRTLCATVLLAALHGVEPAFGWGRDGHEIVGLAAQPLLCRRAQREVARLGDGETLARIGWWADQVRGQPQWRHSAPWHYVNIPDAGDPRNAPRNPEGSVITAIERFYDELRSQAVPDAERAVALRFLVHFVADIHQPLHVGRAEDRGGNRIAVAWADEETNLHSFWDTDAIRLRESSPSRYAAAIAAQARAAAARDRDLQVRDWAAQVFALRPQVYDFDPASGALDAEYLAMAQRLAEQQLTLAAAHLANTLNRIWCG